MLFRNIKLHFFKDKFIRNVLTLIGGAAVAQIIPIIISPIISRLYKVEDFGTLSVYTSIISIVSIIATGRYELAVMLPKEDDDAANILSLSVLISAGVSIVSLAIFWGFNTSITKALGDAAVSRWLFFIPLAVLMGGIYQTLNYWINRKKRYTSLTVSRISQSVTVGILNLSFGIAGAGTKGLIICGLVGQFIQTAILVYSFWKEDREIIESVSFERIKNNAFKYKDFPRINSVHAFVDMLQSSGIVFLISSLYGSRVLGLYSFTLRILKMPMLLIGSAVGQVFYQQATEVYNNRGDLGGFTKKVVTRLCLVSAPVFTILVLFGPQLFSIVLGSKWQEAGVYAQVFALSVFMNFIVSPISHIPMILHRHKEALIIGVVSNLLDIVSIGFGSILGKSVFWGFAVLSAVRFVKLVLILLWYLKLIKKYGQDRGEVV